MKRKHQTEATEFSQVEVFHRNGLWCLTSMRDLLAWHQTQKVFYEEWTDWKYLTEIVEQSFFTLSEESFCSGTDWISSMCRLGKFTLVLQALDSLAFLSEYIPSPKTLWQNWPKKIYPLQMSLEGLLGKRTQSWPGDRMPSNCLTFQQKCLLQLVADLLWLYCRAGIRLIYRNRLIPLSSPGIHLSTEISLFFTVLY